MQEILDKINQFESAGEHPTTILDALVQQGGEKYPDIVKKVQDFRNQGHLDTHILGTLKTNISDSLKAQAPPVTPSTEKPGILSKTGNILKTVPSGVVEAGVANLVGLTTFPVGPITQVAQALTGKPGEPTPTEARRQAEELINYKPRTKLGEKLTEVSALPFQAAFYPAQKAGELAKEKFGEGLAQTGIQVGAEAATLLAMGGVHGAVRKLRGVPEVPKSTTSIPGDAMNSGTTKTADAGGEVPPREEPKAPPSGGKGTEPNVPGAAGRERPQPPPPETKLSKGIFPGVRRRIPAGPMEATGTPSTQGLEIPQTPEETRIRPASLKELQAGKPNKVLGGPSPSEAKGLGLSEAPKGPPPMEPGTHADTGAKIPVPTDFTTKISGVIKDATQRPENLLGVFGKTKVFKANLETVRDAIRPGVKGEPEDVTQYLNNHDTGFGSLGDSILIDESADPKAYPALIEKALAEKKILDRGGTQSEANTAGEKRVSRTKEGANGTNKMIPQMSAKEKADYGEKITSQGTNLEGLPIDQNGHSVDQYGNRVVIVDGSEIEKTLPNFTQGANTKAYPGIVPENTILLDKRNHPDEQMAILTHESQELQRMKNGENYNKAHEEATKDEWNSRHGLPVEPVAPRYAITNEGVWPGGPKLNAGDQMLVAKDGGKRVGFLWYTPVEGGFEVRRIQSEKKGEGIGTSLMKEAEKETGGKFKGATDYTEEGKRFFKKYAPELPSQVKKEVAPEPEKAEAPKEGIRDWLIQKLLKAKNTQEKHDLVGQMSLDEATEALKQSKDSGTNIILQKKVGIEKPKTAEAQSSKDMAKQFRNLANSTDNPPTPEIKKVLLSLADMHEKGTVPEALAKIESSEQIKFLLHPPARLPNKAEKSLVSGISREKARKALRELVEGKSESFKGEWPKGVREKIIAEMHDAIPDKNDPLWQHPELADAEARKRYGARLAKEGKKTSLKEVEEPTEKMPLTEWDKANVGPNKIHKPSGRSGEEILRASDEAYRKRQEAKNRMGAGAKGESGKKLKDVTDGDYNKGVVTLSGKEVNELERSVKMAAGPHVDLKLQEGAIELDLRDPGTRLAAEEHLGKEEVEARMFAGKYKIKTPAVADISGDKAHQVGGVIRASMEVTSKEALKSNVNHEIFHPILDRYATDAQKKLLNEKFPREGTKSEREVQSDKFAEFCKDPDSIRDGGVKKIFQGIKDILTRIGNWYRGLGYQTVGDIFEAARNGELRRRAVEKSKAESRAGIIPGTRTAEAMRKLAGVNEEPPIGGEEERRRAAGIPENLHPIEMPELLRYFRGLGTEGKIKLVRAVRLMGGKVLGTFFPNTGNINLARDLFRDPAMASKVFSHELGHLTDWLPDKAILRGNLLGHIASLRDYMKKYLAEYPGSPQQPMTEAEMKVLRTEAERQAKEGAPKVSITPEDIKAVWNNLEKKNPGLESYIKGMTDQQKSELVRAAMKGKIPDWFSYSKAAGETKKSVQETFEKLVQEEITKRRLYDSKQITMELRHFTQRWNPFVVNRNPRYTRYRFSAEELYADALSGLYQNPELLKQVAPGFTKGFFNYLERKPEVKEHYDAIQKLISAGPEEVGKVRHEAFGEMLQKGEEAAQTKPPEVYKHRGWMKIREEFLDKFTPVYDLIRGNNESLKKARAKIHDMIYGDSEGEAHFKEVMEWSIKPLEEAGVKPKDYSEFLTLQRILNERGGVERGEIANPKGYDPKTAKDALDYLKKQVGDKQWQAMVDAQKNWNNERQLHIIPEVVKSGMYSDALTKKMQDNNFWATFNPRKFAERGFGKGITGRIFGQKGTLEDIQDPFASSIAKDVSIMKAVNYNNAVKSVISAMKEATPDLIKQAPRVWSGRGWRPQGPKQAGQGMLIYLNNSKPVGYHVPIDVARAFEKSPVEQLTGVKFLSTLTRPFREIFINKRPGFWGFNLMRDLQSALRTVPGAGSHPLAFTAKWLRAFPDAYRGVKDYDISSQSMLRKKELISSVDRTGESPENTQLEKMMIEHGYYNPPAANGVYQALKQFAVRLERGMDVIAASGERPSKIAADRWLREKFPEMKEAEIAWHVRQAGSPMFLVKGSYTPITNNLIFLSNAAAEGYKTQWEYAKLDPATFAAKAVAYGVLPRLVMWTFGAGILGQGTKEVYDMITHYDKWNYLCVPLGKTKEGKAVYFRMPQDEQTRLIGGIMQGILDGVKTPDDMLQIMDFTSNQFPGVNPLITMVGALKDVTTGQNPWDSFRNRQVIPDQVFKANDYRKWLSLGQYLWNTAGGSIIYKFNNEKPERIKGELEKIVNAPILSDLLGRFLKVSDYGITEKVKENLKPVAEQEAQMALDLKDGVEKVLTGKGNRLTPKEIFAMAAKPGALDENIQRMMAHQHGALYVEQYLRAPSVAQKMVVLQTWVQSLQPQKKGIPIPGVRQ